MSQKTTINARFIEKKNDANPKIPVLIALKHHLSPMPLLSQQRRSFVRTLQWLLFFGNYFVQHSLFGLDMEANFIFFIQPITHIHDASILTTLSRQVPGRHNHTQFTPWVEPASCVCVARPLTAPTVLSVDRTSRVLIPREEVTLFHQSFGWILNYQTRAPSSFWTRNLNLKTSWTKSVISLFDIMKIYCLHFLGNGSP